MRINEAIEITWSAGRPARLAARAPSERQRHHEHDHDRCRINELVSLPLIWLQMES